MIENGSCDQTPGARRGRRSTPALRGPRGTERRTPSAVKGARRRRLALASSCASGLALSASFSSLSSWADRTKRDGAGRELEGGKTVEYRWCFGGISGRRAVQNRYDVDE